MAQPELNRKSLYFNYPEYPFIRPAELDGESRQHPVVIVGAGPIGMTAALELARHGIRTVVLDDKNTVNEGSRAVCIARHSMECLQQIGLAETFEKKRLTLDQGQFILSGQAGLPVAHAAPGVGAILPHVQPATAVH